jgi:hypothetical protein
VGGAEKYGEVPARLCGLAPLKPGLLTRVRLANEVSRASGEHLAPGWLLTIVRQVKTSCRWLRSSTPCHVVRSRRSALGVQLDLPVSPASWVSWHVGIPDSCPWP